LLNRFHHNDGVVHNQADSKYQANSESVLMEKPSTGNMAKVPISETGTASRGIKVARHP